MQSALEGARRVVPPAEFASEGKNSESLLAHIVHWLDEAKAEEVVTIDLRNKSSIGQYMVIAGDRYHRHVGAIADQVEHQLKERRLGPARREGAHAWDWVLID